MSKLDQPYYYGRLRFRFPAPKYKWVPTVEEFEQAPFSSIILYESLYVAFLVLAWLVAFTVGLLIGTVIAH